MEEVSVAVVDSGDEQGVLQGRVAQWILVVPSLFVCMYVCMYVCMKVCIYINLCVYVCMYVCIIIL